MKTKENLGRRNIPTERKKLKYLYYINNLCKNKLYA